VTVRMQVGRRRKHGKEPGSGEVSVTDVMLGGVAETGVIAFGENWTRVSRASTIRRDTKIFFIFQPS